VKKNIETGVRKIFNNILPETKKHFELKRAQSEYRDWDSFAQMQIATEIERVFSVQLSIKEIISADSAARFIALIEKKT